MHRTKIDEEVMDLLFENAAAFLNGGIELLFSDAVSSRAAKMAVVSIQTSMELLAKFRLVEGHRLARRIREDLHRLDRRPPLRKGVDRRYLRLTVIGALSWSLFWFKKERDTPATIAKQILSMLRAGNEDAK
jgi:hypothetical protein